MSVIGIKSWTPDSFSSHEQPCSIPQNWSAKPLLPDVLPELRFLGDEGGNPHRLAVLVEEVLGHVAVDRLGSDSVNSAFVPE